MRHFAAHHVSHWHAPEQAHSTAPASKICGQCADDIMLLVAELSCLPGSGHELSLLRSRRTAHLTQHALRRYTSYGRHFTQPGYLQVVNQRLLPLLRPGDTIVDFSCGENTWVPMLKEMCLRGGWVNHLA